MPLRGVCFSRLFPSPLLPLSGEVGPEEDQEEEEEQSPRGRSEEQERTDVLGSHDEALALLGPRVALLVRSVDQRVRPLVLLDVLAERLDRLGQGPPLHLGLIPEVFDLLLDAFFIHGDGGCGRRTGGAGIRLLRLVLSRRDANTHDGLGEQSTHWFPSRALAHRHPSRRFFAETGRTCGCASCHRRSREPRAGIRATAALIH